MSFAKTHLKAARDGITKKDYVTAKKESALVLDFEPENYNAHVFLALAHLELGELDQSEQIYRKAIALNPAQPLAWQGLSNFYDRKGDWMKQAEVLVQLVGVFNKSQDAVKCAETLQKLIVLYRNNGSRQQIISGLSYYLPESKVYSLLSTLPPPDPTNPTGSTTNDAQEAIHNGFRVLEEVVALTEALEADTFKREVERQRMRLGAGTPEQLRKEVFLEIFDKSQLITLYESILNHPNTSDELRRDIEAKQLRYKQQYLQSIPATADGRALKQKVAHELDELVQGIVLLKKPDELGWRMHFEGTDCEDLSEYGRDHVRSYIRLFPESALSSLFRGYFAYNQEVLSEDEEEQALFSLDEDVDPLDTILNSSLGLSDTILGTRILAEVYLNELDYENAIKTSKQGLRNLNAVESDLAKSLPKTRTGLQVVLSTSLVHFFSPKHHLEATRVIDEILARSPKNTASLMGRGYILQAALSWDEAAAVFDRVSALLPDDMNLGLRAKEEHAWCAYQLGRYEESLVQLQQVMQILEGLVGDYLNHERARCLWRIGKCNMSIGGTSIQEGYKSFISALKQDPEFAPAFTSLGIYYLEQSSPPDPIRSSKCFQKAFELDARETIAARRLAEGFANDREWDLVEVVAQRTIDGEGGLNAGLQKAELDATSRYLPTNSWAWKAVGVVKFHYKDYPAAIQAFQISLRVEPEDQPLWVRLGEAYNKAGRHVAALKALTHAHEMNPDDWLCSYFIADVKQCMGLYEDATVILEAIRETLPDEAGVLALLGQVHLDLGCSQVSDGFQIRAEQSFMDAIEVALNMIERVPGFRTIAWKIIGDAAFQLSRFFTFIKEEAIRQSLQVIKFLPPQERTEQIVKIVPLPSFSEEESLSGLQAVIVSIYAYLCQLSLSQASSSGSWYDVAVALQSWTEKTTPTTDTKVAKEKSIEFLKKAIQLDIAKDIYWAALGNAYFLTHAKAAQHAYIRALEIDSKNADTWVKLGLLYAYHGDVELANEALYRAQVLDPDNTLAWVGQFLIAMANGHETDATLLLEHAVGLPNPVSEADYEYSSQVFTQTKKLQHNDQVQEVLLPAFFFLNRYCQHRPSDASGLHLLSLVCERLGHLSFGEELVQGAIKTLETAYEETEDPEVENRYVIANTTLGRLLLAQGAYEQCITSFETALGLLADKDDATNPTQALKVQAQLGSGLAHFFLGNLEAALGFLEDGHAVAGSNQALRGHVTLVLAQTLWAIGTEEAKETAKSRLLECIASDPENLAAINALAGMGILTNDDGLVDAALSEILALPIEQKHQLDPERHVDYLLIQHHLAQNDTKAAFSTAQHAVFAEPSRLGPRTRLATLMLQTGLADDPPTAASDALSVLGSTSGMADAAEGGVDAAGLALSIRAVAQALQKDSEELPIEEKGSTSTRIARAQAQRAIIMRPSAVRGWQTLAYVRTLQAPPS
ncbi:TPR-like protein [Pholiota conissans]|uniref:TPR-like protein n=1 Tax=Pholiota conissans TaxID=109636 RepID=A0A9P5ZA80_9AGAR|nr:TPR-like protein [Pholiota conissans]